MENNSYLLKNKRKKGKVSVSFYKNGFRASMNLKYRDGTKERIEKYSTYSPQEALEKLYLEANKRYLSNLYKFENGIVFSIETNAVLKELELEMPENIIYETKNCLKFKEMSKAWLDYMLSLTDSHKTNRGITNNTFEYYRTMTNSYLVSMFGEMRVNEISLDIMQAVFDSMTNLKHKTLKGLRSILVQILDFCIKKGYIKENFAKFIELPPYEKPKIDFYNEQEIKEFKLACDKDGRPIAILYRTILSIGVRPEEGCGLKWNKIAWSKSEEELAIVTIDNAYKDIKIYDDNHNIVAHKKADDTLKNNGSYRNIPLQKEDETALRHFYETEKVRLGNKFDENGYIFLNRYGRPYTPEILTNKMPVFLKKWNLPHITPYGLRHSFASLYAKKNVNSNVLKTMMGHTDISTTHKYYIHLRDSDLAEEVKEKFNTETKNDNTELLLNIQDMLLKMQKDNSQKP